MYILLLLSLLNIAQPSSANAVDTVKAGIVEEAKQADQTDTATALAEKGGAVVNTVIETGIETTKSISETLTKMKDDAINDLLSTGIKAIIDLSLKLVIGILLIIIGMWVIKRILKANRIIFERRNFDPTFASFLANFINVALYVGLILLVISVIGFESTSLVAILASTGVGIGMAMSGTLQNFAGGIIILFLRPYRVGDVINVVNTTGTVREIQIFHTVITTVDNRVIMIPNGSISSSVIDNYSKEETRRAEWKFGIAYGNDYEDVKRLINDLLDNDPRVIQSKDRLIVLDSLADSSVIILARAWVNASDYAQIKWDINEKFYKQYAKYNLSLPFPQMDVHLKKEEN